MLTMAKKKPTKRPGRPRIHQDRVFLQVRVPQAFKDAFQQLARDNHRGDGDEMLLALENHMRAAGRWPIPPAPDRQGNN